MVPSLDTPICDAQTKRFNEAAVNLPGVDIFTVSMDLPFAQKRWCGAFAVDRVRMFSDHRDASFGAAWGTLIKELRIESRAIFVLDKDDTIRYVEYVPEVAVVPQLRSRASRGQAGDGTGGIAAARARAFMSTQSPLPAFAAERVITRAVESPLVRGGLTIGAGIVTGNIIGFARVALTAYLLGTHSLADSLAVAVGPLDTLNAVLINSMVFAFVPMLTERKGAQRTALFLKLTRCFAWLFSLLALGIVIFAPWLIRALAPGLDPAYYATSVMVLRIVSLSTMAAGMSAIHSALLYTDRRFAPSAFYQASLNLFTIVGALSFWKVMGVYGFAIGYTAGGVGATGRGVLVRAFGAGTAGRAGFRGGLAQAAREAAGHRGFRRGHGAEHHLHARLGHARGARHGRRARLLHARRGRAAGLPGQPDVEFAAAGDRAAAGAVAAARGFPPHRPHAGARRRRRRGRVRLRHRAARAGGRASCSSAAVSPPNPPRSSRPCSSGSDPASSDGACWS